MARDPLYRGSPNNGRLCGACKRPLYKDEFHEIKTVTHVDEDSGDIVGKGIVRCCRVRLIADETAVDLATGKRIVRRHVVPETPQRTKANNARFVPEAAFAPGGPYS